VRRPLDAGARRPAGGAHRRHEHDAGEVAAPRRVLLLAETDQVLRAQHQRQQRARAADAPGDEHGALCGRSGTRRGEAGASARARDGWGDRRSQPLAAWPGRTARARARSARRARVRRCADRPPGVWRGRLGSLAPCGPKTAKALRRATGRDGRRTIVVEQVAHVGHGVHRAAGGDSAVVVAHQLHLDVAPQLVVRRRVVQQHPGRHCPRRGAPAGGLVVRRRSYGRTARTAVLDTPHFKRRCGRSQLYRRAKAARLLLLRCRAWQRQGAAGASSPTRAR